MIYIEEGIRKCPRCGADTLITCGTADGRSVVVRQTCAACKWHQIRDGQMRDDVDMESLEHLVKTAF
jgi:transcription elongation factor Elf1